MDGLIILTGKGGETDEGYEKDQSTGFISCGNRPGRGCFQRCYGEYRLSQALLLGTGLYHNAAHSVLG